jgi:hypothetical protein
MLPDGLKCIITLITGRSLIKDNVHLRKIKILDRSMTQWEENRSAKEMPRHCTFGTIYKVIV